MNDTIKVLYVDDEAPMLEIAKEFLEAQGRYEVETAASARLALDLMEIKNFDAIVSDYSMPEMDGIELLKRLRRQGDRTPFLLFTGKGREDVVIDALNNGADFYLQKGGDPRSQFAELASMIDHVVKRRQAECALVESEKKFRDLVLRANDGIVILQDNVVKYANPRMLGIVGYTFEEVLGTQFLRYVDPREARTLADNYRKRMAGGQFPSVYETVLLHKDGRKMAVEMNAGVIDYDERPADFLIIRDISERKRNEDAIRARTEEYQAIFHSVPVMIAYKDTENRLLRVNRTYSEVIGLPIEALEGRCMKDIMPDESDQLYADDLEVMKTGNTKSNMVRRISTASGDKRWALESKVPYRDENGAVRGIILIAEDITERKRIEEERDRLVILSPDMLCIAGFNGYFKQLNPAWHRTLGWSEEELISKPYIDFVHPDDRTNTIKVANLMMEGKPAPAFENRFICKNGTYRWLSWKFYPVVDDLLFSAVVHDITHRKQTEEALKASETRYRRLFETAQDGILIMDNDTGKIIDVNPFLQHMLGYTIDDFLGKQLWEIGPFKDIEASKITFGKLQETGYCRYDNLPLQARSGQTVDVEFVSNSYYVDGHKVIQCNIRDNTRRRKSERELEKVQARLLLSESVGRHDVLNYLSVILGNAELAEKITTDPKLEKYLGGILTAAEAVKAQMKRSKDYKTLGAPAPIWMSTESCLFEAKQGLELEGISVRVNLDRLELLVDPLFERVVHNLIDNSIRHGVNTREIEVHYEKSGEGLTICYEDDGGGIPQDQKESIFEQGLGLPLVRGILATTKMTIVEIGIPGKGVRYEISIPPSYFRFKE